MANRIQLRHGSSAPTVNDLLPFELGWDGDSLYIHNGKNTPAIICIGGTGVSISANSITGTLGVAHGGTGQTSLTQNYILIGNGTSAIQMWDKLPVAQGGTGLTTTKNVNAVVIGNSTTATGALQTVATAQGAFYASNTNAKPQFGTLPVNCGGTGQTTLTANYILVGNGTSAVQMWDKLPVAQGGTNATDAAGARTNLGLGTIATAASTDYLAVSGGNVASLTVGNQALILDSGATQRRIFLTTTEQKPNDAVAGDIVLVKV